MHFSEIQKNINNEVESFKESITNSLTDKLGGEWEMKITRLYFDSEGSKISYLVFGIVNITKSKHNLMLPWLQFSYQYNTGLICKKARGVYVSEDNFDYTKKEVGSVIVILKNKII